MGILALVLVASFTGCKDGTVDTGDTGGVVDLDGDGFPEGLDCDDGDAAVNPDAVELCNDLDDNCNDEVDEGALSTFYADLDEDGYGDDDKQLEACSAPSGYVIDGGDCNDARDDVNPGQVELCNELDDDCNGEVDEGLDGAWFADADGDGFGDSRIETSSCLAAKGYVADASDCDDADAAVNPDAEELCDGLDNDCDELVDDDDDDVADPETFYTDADADSYGDSAAPFEACEEPASASTRGGDCDDADPAVSPAATEVCNDVDDDCDGLVDDDDSALDTSTASETYADRDGDGFGDAGTSELSCDAPSGYVEDGTDCDDDDAAVNPDAPEVCNALDDDCDGLVDDDDPTVDTSTGSTWYADADGDGYGDADSGLDACELLSGYADNADDCDDSDEETYLDAVELCDDALGGTTGDGLDQDCDGTADDGCNSAPSLTSVVLAPDPAYETSTLTCTPTGSDPDGESLSYVYAWDVSGSDPGTTGSSLTGDAFDKGDDVTCTVTPSDGTNTGASLASNTVTVENSVPVASGVAISPTSPTAGDTLTCSYTFTDADDDADGSSLAWTLNGVVVGSTATYSGSFTNGDVIACAVTPSDGTDTGSVVTDSLTVGNSRPEVADATLTPDPAYEGDTFTCTAGSTSDADGDSVSLDYAWSIDGVDNGETGSTLSSDHFDKGDDVACTVTPNDGIDDGLVVTSNSVEVLNTAPVLAGASLSPDPAYEADTVVCAPGSVSDADGDTVSYSYAWTIDGVASSVTSSSISGSQFDKGDELVCSVTPDDGDEDGAAVSTDPLTIDNTPPSIRVVTVSPSAAGVGDTLSCTYSGYDDDDGDADASTTSWTIDGVEVGTGSTLASGFASGDEVVCTVTPFDGTDSGTALSDSVTVDNTAPELADATLTPEFAYESSELTCTPGTATDADGDTVTYSYAWTVDGAEVGTTDSTLDGADFDRGEQVFCTVTPSDGTASGDAVDSNSVTIQNTAPVLASVDLSPTAPVEGDTLTCTPGTVTDDDGDTVTYSYAWTVDGSTVAASGSTLGDTFWDRGEAVICTVTPDDGTDSGDAVASSSVTVQNTAPSITSVSVSPSSPTVDDTLTCTYTGFSDADGDSDASTYSWTLSGTEVGTTSTLSGVFASGDTLTCTVTPDDGTDAGSTVSDSVSVTNTAPVLSDATLTPDPATESDTLTCTAGSVSDADGDAVTYTYAWSVDGADPGVTADTLSGDDFDKDQAVSCTVTPTDGTDDGTAVTSNVVTIDNTPPVLDSVTLGPSDPTEGDTLTCTPGTSTDTDGDTVTFSYSWTVDGTTVAASGATLADSSWDRGEDVVCTVTPDDGDDAGDAVDSNSVTIANSAPSVDAVSVSPSSPAVDDTLTCSYSGFSDADGDGDASTYSWTISGTEVGTSSTLSGTFASGDTITCTVTPDDGTDTGTALSDSVSVENTPPVLSDVTLTPEPATESDTFTCTPGTATDADGDTVTFSYAWAVDGVDPGVSTDTLTGDDFAKDDPVRCTVTPNDGTEDGAAVSSSFVTVQNSPPVLADVALTPTDAAEGDTLTCTPGTASDADGETVTFSYAWTVEGTSVAASGSTLSDSFWDKGDDVVCTVTPDDGDEDGSAASSNTVTIQNSPPVLSDVTLTPTDPAEGDTLTCTPGSSSDADGDTIAYSYAWTVDGSAVGETSDTLDDSFWDKGEDVVCTVTPFDEDEDGSAVASNSVTVQNAPPDVDSVSVSPSSPATADSLSCTATGSDADGDSVSFSYSWTISGTEVGTSSSLSSSSTASGDTVTCTVTPSDGTDDGSTSSDSVTIANTAPVVSSVSISPSSPSTGDTLTCSVSASDADDDTLTTTYSWTISGTEVGTSSTLDGSATTGGDSVFCSATVDDGNGGTDSGSGSVTIVNSAPSVGSVAITPSSPGTGDDLSCSFLASDPDGDTLTYSYSWSIASSEVGTASTLSSSATSKGAAVTCEVTADDGNGGTASDEGQVTIQNTAPTVSSVTIFPSSPGTNDTLTVSYTTNDADGDSVSVTYQWDVGGATVSTSSSIAGTLFDKGESVSVALTPSDGSDSGSAGSDSVTVVNTAPDAPTVDLYPDAPTSSDELVCDITADSPDEDGDSITYTFAWEADGAVYPDDFGSATGPDTTAHTDDTVPSADTSLATDWTCTATPNDGEADGAEASDTVSVVPIACSDITSLTSGGSTYHFCAEAMTGSEALAVCEDAGLHLADLETSTENSTVEATADSLTVADATNGEQHWWFGINDLDVEGTWVWSDGSTPSATNWADGALADLAGDSSRDCAVMVTEVGSANFPDGSWVPKHCDSGGSFGFVCEDP